MSNRSMLDLIFEGDDYFCEGEGMDVVDPSSKIGIIEVIQPNRACHVLFIDSTTGAFREEHLKPLIN